MQNRILYEKLKIARTFNRAAETYENASILEKEMGARLLDRLEFIKLMPAHILDLGGGTGFFSKQLTNRFPASALYNVDLSEGLLNKADCLQHSICADLDYLPLQTNSIDFVFSNSVIHWFENVNTLFKEVHRVLKPGGLFLFSTLGPDTLQELRESFSSIDSEPHVNRFTDMHLIGDALIGAGFSDPVMDRENLTFTYPTVSKLLEDLKLSGSSYVLRENSLKFIRKTFFKEVFSAYERFQLTSREFPATVEIIYGHAVAPDTHLYHIPISQIQRL